MYTVYTVRYYNTLDHRGARGDDRTLLVNLFEEFQERKCWVWFQNVLGEEGPWLTLSRLCECTPLEPWNLLQNFGEGKEASGICV